jgi:DNA-binding SARP family transcriptional activator
VPAEFNLLGEIEVLVDAQPLDLGHARQRSVLAVLLVDANRLVPTGQLVDRVWGEQAPPRVRNTLYGYIHHLRAALAGAADIQRKDGGYLLAVDVNTVDLHRFRAMVVKARAVEDEDGRLSLLRQALELWHGEAFAGAATPWLATVRDSLELERLEARLEHHELALRQGRHAEVLPDLLTLAEEHPLDERIAGQLMLALHRSGRSAAALDHYHGLRGKLADELGVDPGARVQEVFHLMLANDPDPATPRPAEPLPLQQPPAERPPDMAPDDGHRPGPGPLRSRTGVIVSVAALIVVMAGVLIATQALRREEPTTPAGAAPSVGAVESQDDDPPTPGTPPPVPPAGVYDFQLAHSSLCLSERPGQSDGQVFQTDCRNDIPVYSLEPLRDGVYHIASDHPTFEMGCLGIPKRSRDIGAGAYDAYCDEGAAEEFRVEPVGSPEPGFRLRAVHSDLCLGADNASRAEWTPILQVPCDDDVEGQVFTLIPPVS